MSTANSPSLNLPVINSQERKNLSVFLSRSLDLQRLPGPTRHDLQQLLYLVQQPNKAITQSEKNALHEFLIRRVQFTENRTEIDNLNLLVNLVSNAPLAPEPEALPTPAPVAPAPASEPAQAARALPTPIVRKTISWQQLRDFCNNLPEQFLPDEVFAYDTAGEMIVFSATEQLEEPYYDFGYGLEGLSYYPDKTPEDLANADGYLPEGTPSLIFHPYNSICHTCGCTDQDCSQCIAAAGKPCSWVAPGLCSRCSEEQMKGGSNG